MLGYIITISFLHSLRLNHFMNGFDIAFYQQAIWNTTQGRFLQVSATDFSNSLFGTDVILIYALMSPFYALIPTTLTLLIIETIIVAAGALPIYWLAKERLASGWLGIALALIYLLLPAVQNGNLYELRERPMAGAFLLFAFYFWQKKRLTCFIIAAVLALCCRPENGLVLIMLSLYASLSKPFEWRFVLTPILLGLTWFAAALLLIQFATGGSGFALGSTFAGGSPLAVPINLLTNPALGLQQLFPTPQILYGKLLYLPLLLLPLAFLPLRRPLPLLMALPSIGLNLLANEQRQLQWTPFDYHYQGSIVPWLIIATIFSLENFIMQKSWLTTLTLIALTLTISMNIATNLLILELPGVPPVKHGWAAILRNSTRNDARWEIGQTMLKKVPNDAPIAITNLWAIQIEPRRGLWYFAKRNLYSLHPAQAAQYVFADTSRPDSDETRFVEELLQQNDWQIIANQAGYALLKRK